MVAKQEDSDSLSISRIFTLAAIVSSLVGFFLMNWIILKEINRRINLGIPIWSQTILVYVLVIIFTGGSIGLIIWCNVIMVKNPHRAWILCILGSYPVLMQGFINSIFIFESQYEYMFAGYSICSWITFLSAISAALLIIKSLIFQSQKKFKVEEQISVELPIPTFEITVGILSILGSLINFIALGIYIKQAGVILRDWIYSLSIIGVIAFLGGLSAILVPVFVKKKKFFRLFFIFVGYWGTAVYIYSYISLPRHVIDFAFFTNLVIFLIALVLSQLNGISILREITKRKLSDDS